MNYETFMNKMCSLNYYMLKSCYPLLSKCIEINNNSYQSIKQIKQVWYTKL